MYDQAQLEITEALTTMKIGERIGLGDGIEVMAVPMGWIFYRTHKAGITGTYVPFIPAPAKKPTIELV